MNLKHCKGEKVKKLVVPGIVTGREFPVAGCEQGVVSMGREAEGAGRSRCGHVCTRARLDAFSRIQIAVVDPAGLRIPIDLMRIRIRIQHFFYLRIRDPDPGLMS